MIGLRIDIIHRLIMPRPQNADELAASEANRVTDKRSWIPTMHYADLWHSTRILPYSGLFRRWPAQYLFQKYPHLYSNRRDLHEH